MTDGDGLKVSDALVKLSAEVELGRQPYSGSRIMLTVSESKPRGNVEFVAKIDNGGAVIATIKPESARAVIRALEHILERVELGTFEALG